MAQAVLHETAVARSTCALARSRQRGFTLVELGAVVVIVSILAVLAVVGFRRLITSSHAAEATHMINAIRVAQESYHAETGLYADISSKVAVTGGTDCGPNKSYIYPTLNQTPGAFKSGWGGACGGACPNAGIDWTTIPLHVDGPVMYGYSTQAGLAGSTPPSTTMFGKSGSYTITPAQQPTEWFLVGACGDPDGDGIASSYLGASFTNEIYESNEGN